MGDAFVVEGGAEGGDGGGERLEGEVAARVGGGRGGDHLHGDAALAGDFFGPERVVRGVEGEDGSRAVGRVCPGVRSTSPLFLRGSA